jgi:acyl transferase domain-containing protein/phosphopantetheinyl transferase (holo-ACP synthase)
MTVAPGIAITGMSCLFPGAPGLDAYWHNILRGDDSVSDPPPEAWDPDVYYDPEFTNPDATYCKRGGYLGSLASFDALAHGVPPVAVGGEPDQWLALHVAMEALADAGATELPPEVRRRTAIVLGKGTYLNGGNAIAVQRGLVLGQTIDLIRRLHPEHSEEQFETLRRELQAVLPPLGPDTVPGLIPNIVVGRIANRLDLMGPAYTVDAACASSLVAVQQAVRDLLDGACDLALAGGAQVWMPVATLNLFCRLGALSRTQQIKPFDKNADGTLLGEGIGMIVLKRLADAERDGDRIYAVIRGVGLASDGRGVGVMAPRVEGEELALRRAYEAAGVAPRSVGLIEAHGTGTPVGDVVEIEALTRVFGERNGDRPTTAVGTVKSMISHTIPAAGVAGIIKTALALHHRVLPPTLHCDEPNPKLGLDRTPFYINTETRPWIHGGRAPRRAGVNAFGFGGINAHAILEEHGEGAHADHRPPWETELFLLEAESPEALAAAAQELLGALGHGAEPVLADLAYSLGRELGRIDQPLRLAIVAGSIEDLRARLEQAVEKLRRPDTKRIRAVSGIYYAAEPLGRDGKVVLVFPGEGAQYPNMLADLCLHFDDVRGVFDRIDRLYEGHPRGDLLSDWVFPRPAFSDAERARAEERLMQLDIAVESVLTANGAMYALMRRILGRIDAVVGHSTGEHSAALVSGVLDVDTDERLQAFSQGLYRAYADASSRHDIPGAVLLALGAGAGDALRIAEAAGGELHLAMDNCPHQAVLVGEPDAAARVRTIARAEGLVCEVLPYDRAVHTPLFAPFAEDLRAVFAGLPVASAATELWSCTTAAPYPSDPAAIRDLLVEHWTNPVRFRETIEALYDAGARLFVEVGPRGNMTAFVEDILRGRPSCAVATDVRRRSGMTQLNHAVGQLTVHGADVDLAPLFAERTVHEIDWRAPADPASSRADKSVPLSTGWPMLRIDDAVVERFAAPAPAPAPAPAERAAPLPAAVRSLAPASFAGGAPAAPAAADGTDEDELAAALDAHLRTMESFLAATGDVMQAYLGGPAPALPPLLGTVVACEPGVELVAHRVVDATADPYLGDHTLGRIVSHTDPGLTGLALMPLALSLEILAEAAGALVPDRTVTGLRDVRAHRWLSFSEGPQTLEVNARRLPSGQVRAELRTLAGDGAASAPAVEATVVLDDRYPASPVPIAPELGDGRPARWGPGRLYGEAMFHGPIWQAVEAIDTVASAGVLARLRVLGDDPGFVLDPVVLDAAGQVIGFWAADQLSEGRVIFPFRLAALDLHGPRPSEGEPLTCVAAVDLLGDTLMRSDIDVLTADGRCWMRLTGWEDKRFHVPERFAPLTMPSELPPLSAPWDVAADGGLAVRRVDARLPADGALWEPAWAGRVLTRTERAAFSDLERPEGRRLEWLGARTAAKEAVVELLREHHGLGLLPADVEILPDEHGCPRVSVPGFDGRSRPVVSLSHSHGQAAAAAALVAPGAETGIGIDIEHVRPLPAGFEAAALTPGERRLLDGVPPERRDEWLLRAWCAKEAAAKATGTAMTPAPYAATLEALDGGDVVVTVGGRRLSVHTRRDGELIVATTLSLGQASAEAA